MADDGIGIGAISCVVPTGHRKVVELDEFDQLDAAEAEFARGCGIDTVSITDGPGAPLAADAIRELHPYGGTAPDLLVVVAARAPDVLLGSDVARVQHLAGLPAALGFTVDGLGCTGSSAAWGLARDLLAADAGRASAVIAHASRPTGAQRIRYPVTVIGDGACAMTLVRGGRPVLRGHLIEMDGSFHDLFTVDYRQTPWYEWREECASPDRYRFEYALHSRQRLVRMVDAVLDDAELTRADVAATVMQNVTASAFDFYETLLQLPIHPVCREHLRRYGHLGAMDVILNLDRLLSSGELNRGDHVLVLNNSPVAAWAVTLWEV